MTDHVSVFGAVPTDGERWERMRASPRFLNGRFENTRPVGEGLKPGTSLATIGEFFRRGGRRAPTAPLPVENPLAAWAEPVRRGLRVTWLGHSTTLIEIDGFRVLTDPVWGARVSPVGWAGPKRFHPTPVSVEQLPDLDAVLVSHDHFDHLDLPAIRALAKRDVPFVTALGVGAHLESWGVAAARITELDWWEQAVLCGGALSFTAAPAQHFSGRGVGGRNRTLWASWAVRTDRHRVFFSGDTGLTPEFEAVGARLGPFDLTMLEVGAFHPAWGDIHLGPENALRAFHMLGGGTLLPVHWGTFNLALHAWDEPAETLVALAEAQGARVITPRLGSPVIPARELRLDPWWRGVGAAHAVRDRDGTPARPAEDPAQFV